MAGTFDDRFTGLQYQGRRSSEGVSAANRGPQRAASLTRNYSELQTQSLTRNQPEHPLGRERGECVAESLLLKAASTDGLSVSRSSAIRLNRQGRQGREAPEGAGGHGRRSPRVRRGHVAEILGGNGQGQGPHRPVRPDWHRGATSFASPAAAAAERDKLVAQKRRKGYG